MLSNKRNFLFLGVILLASLGLSAQEGAPVALPIAPVGDSLVAPDLSELMVEMGQAPDTTLQDTIQPSGGALLDKVIYKAKDYVRINQK